MDHNKFISSDLWYLGFVALVSGVIVTKTDALEG